MSENTAQDESEVEHSGSERYEIGNDIARRARTETPRLDVLRDELPELSEKELRLLDDNIEKAIRDTVARTLRDREDRKAVTDGGVDQSEAAVERIDKLDDLEISVHHTVRLQHRTHRWEYEVHAGMADVLEIPKPLAELAETVIGVDLERDNIETAAEIRVVEDA